MEPDEPVEGRLGQHPRRRRDPGLRVGHGHDHGRHAGQAVWSHLLTAVAKGKQNPNGYTYALASQYSPETLTIWHNGHVVLKSLVNTGIPASPTADGTFPVYLKYYFSYMKGTNPDGSKYDNPVYYASYFNGGDAVHQFRRYSYGYYQSLGCVELPWDAAKAGLAVPDLRQPRHRHRPGGLDAPGGRSRPPVNSTAGRSRPGPPRSCSFVTCYSGCTSSACGPLGPRPAVLNPLVLLEGAEAVDLDGGVVDEDVGRAIVRGDETIALVRVEPLHGALRHVLLLLRRLREPRSCVPGCCDHCPCRLPCWAGRSGMQNARGQNFAGAVTRTRTSCNQNHLTTHGYKHVPARPEMPHPAAATVCSAP